MDWLSDPRFAEARQNWDTNPEKAFQLLNSLRRKYGWGVPDLAPMEHEAFMRAWVNEDPWKAIPAGLLAPLAYQGAKAIGLRKADTPASADQLGAAYGGYLKGILDLTR